MKNIFLYALALTSSFLVVTGEEVATETINDESDEIYWETPKYLSMLSAEKNPTKVHYVYHRRMNNFKGNWIIPLNQMPYTDGFSEIYKDAIARYHNREDLLSIVIPTLNCLWNDVIFLSPVHPNKQYEAYKKIGFTPKHLEFFKIPIEVLKEKRVSVWKWLSYKKYLPNDPIHDALDSYCDIDFSLYQEMDELPEDTMEYYMLNFDENNPGLYPKFNWYRIPHILCQDSIDILDERITLINWEDPIEK